MVLGNIRSEAEMPANQGPPPEHGVAFVLAVAVTARVGEEGAMELKWGSGAGLGHHFSWGGILSLSNADAILKQ